MQEYKKKIQRMSIRKENRLFISWNRLKECLQGKLGKN